MRNMTKKYEYSYIKNFFKKEGYELLSKTYPNAMTPMKVRCPNGHVTDMTFTNFRRGHRCKRCSMTEFNKRNRKSIDEIRNFLEKDGYELISKEYLNSDAELLVRCPDGHIFDTNWRKLRSGNKCRYCNTISHGEKRIERFLNKNKIEFEKQYIIKDCKFKRYLPFDFYLSDYNLLIEYDGIGHYEIKEYFGGYEGFVDTKIRDTIKNIYCKDNNIDLLRIPYWEFDNIENILIDKLRQANTELTN